MLRREILRLVSAAMALGLGGRARALQSEAVPAPQPTEGVGPGQRFSRAALLREAERLAGENGSAERQSLPQWMTALNYDAYRRIRFNPEKTMLRPGHFGLQLFHAGFLFRDPVSISILEDGIVTTIPYDPELFIYRGNIVPPDTGRSGSFFAGFRLHYALNLPGIEDELIAFQGASYFRLLGSGQHYGLSARGLAIDVASGKGEEFPHFSAFWIERPVLEADDIVIHALLESRTLTGAYRFFISPGDYSSIRVDATLFLRGAPEKLAIAPLTSMFLSGEQRLRRFDDFRPEVHDSDGLLINNGAGEWLWRPLTNPRQLAVNAFTDNNPRGFGLFQRDAQFANYQDLEASYHRRPSYWVEPIGDWGAGHVELVEIPSDSETNDNIVACWVPAKKAASGQRLDYSWRMTALDSGLSPHRLARVASSFSAPPMAIGSKEKAPADARRFILDYEGEMARYLSGLIGELRPDLTARAGRVSLVSFIKNEETGGMRIMFDAFPEPGKTIDLRCGLLRAGKAVSEVWLYSYRGGAATP